VLFLRREELKDYSNQGDMTDTSNALLKLKYTLTQWELLQIQTWIEG
jgi:hypothetical protein